LTYDLTVGATSRGCKETLPDTGHVIISIGIER